MCLPSGQTGCRKIKIKNQHPMSVGLLNPIHSSRLTSSQLFSIGCLQTGTHPKYAWQNAITPEENMSRRFSGHLFLRGWKLPYQHVKLLIK
jgi:hypothetical protein